MIFFYFFILLYYDLDVLGHGPITTTTTTIAIAIPLQSHPYLLMMDDY
jgi:hypothetical protein